MGKGGAEVSFHTERHVKQSRKERECNWCWEAIPRGTPYTAAFGTFEGDTYKSNYHPECSAAIPRWVRAYSDWSEPLPEERMNRGGIEMHGEEEKP
jgi:hypothetical protein